MVTFIKMCGRRDASIKGKIEVSIEANKNITSSFTYA